MKTRLGKFYSLVDLLRDRAEKEADGCAFVFLRDRGQREVRMSYGELDRRARNLGGYLQDVGRAGDCVALLYPPGPEFVIAFLGCLCSGRVAVPLYPPRAGQKHFRSARAIEDCGARLALASRHAVIALEGLSATSPALANLELLDTDNLPEKASPLRPPPAIEGRHLAFLQYTSGSTATPKGVMVSHGNLMANQQAIAQGFGTRREDVCLSWLPLYHDMGLIGTVLHALYQGFVSILMPPVDFIRRPLGWLEAIDRHRATVCGAPNFAYELLAHRATPECLRSLDLSSWRLAFNGAEPVRPSTLERFARTFEPAGFRREAFFPCYGLAESTLFVAGGVAGEVPVVRRLDAEALAHDRVLDATAEDGEKVRSLVGCTQAARECRIVIVDPATLTPCGEGRVGEIWVSGPSVTQGYWGLEQETEQAFRAHLAGESDGSFLRTGDLGFLARGELFVTGRLKDLLILRGRNHYPQDIEATVEGSHPALQPGGGAAFSVEVDAQEELVVVQEVARRHRRADTGEVIDAIRAAVARRHELRAHAVILVAPGGVPKTTSGKVRRSACRDDFLAGRLPELARGESSEAGGAGVLPEEETLGPAWLLRQLVAEVLGVRPEAIRTEQPLVTLGIDSLMAIELEHRLENEHGLALPIDRILSGASLEALVAEAFAAPTTGSAATRPGAGTSAGLEHPLSQGQRALWFLHRLAPEQAAYHIVAAARIRSKLDVARLRRALTALAQRHPALRASFHAPAGEPLQRIGEEPPEFHVEDVSRLRDAELRDHLEQWAYRPFDLERGPLLRLAVFTGEQREPVLVLSLHHLVADFWSLAVLARELEALYSRESHGELPPATPGYSYADFVSWQREHLAGEEGERLWSYWSGRLAGAPDQLDLPSDRPRPPQQGFRGACQDLRLDAGQSRTLEALSRSHSVTLYMTLLAAFGVLLSRISGRHDLLVGSPSAGRTATDFATCVGYFVNPLVLRVELSGEPRFDEILGRVRQTVLEAFAHQEYPFALLAERLRPQRDTSRSPLFQVMFSWQQAPRGADEGLPALALGQEGVRIELRGLVLESMAWRERTSQFDLSLRMARLDTALVASLQYDSDLFDATTARRLLGHLENLLACVAAEPRRDLGDLSLLGPAEQHELLVEWNDTCRWPAPEPTIHGLFEHQAKRRPEAVAVVFADRQLTYDELDARANRFARKLGSCGAGPEVAVGLFLERSCEMVVAALAVLKSGGAYVPLDPAFPAQRLGFMLADAEARVLVSEGELMDSLEVDRSRVRILDVTAAGQREDRDDMRPGFELSGENLAYVIYTSGSTGRPKGVEIHHRSVVSFLSSMARAPGLTPQDVLLAVTTLSFDIAGLELFLPLSVGAKLVVAGRDEASDGARLSEMLEACRVTVMQATPATWRMLGVSGWHGSRDLKILCGGEALPSQLARELLEHGDSVWNLYGPTETTVWSALQQVVHCGPEAQAAEPIGRPLANTRIHVMRPFGRQVPVGVPGELLIGGLGLARGYHARPGLSAEKLVPDPMSEVPGERLYRVGDLARYRPGGEIEFLGRIDHQVKIRGFRIELGEIEAVLGTHPALRANVVVAREGAAGDQRLVAYVVARPESCSEVGDVRGFLRGNLPDYMVPAAVVVLEALPLTPNGKVDRKALPAPDWGSATAGENAPRTPEEELLAAIWADVLGLDRVSVDDNFFEQGGHSLLATLLISRVEKVFGVELPVRSVFEAPTVTRLARRIAQALQAGETVAAVPITPVPRQGPLPLSFAQERLWFLDRLEPGTALYNLAYSAELKGRLHVPVLGRSLLEVVRRHEVLRTTFREEEGGPAQVIAAQPSFSMPVVDLADLDTLRRRQEVRRLSADESRRPFVLARGPLLRATLLRHGEDCHVLLLTMHHIVSDGWSMGVLAQEMGLCYRAFHSAEPSPLPAPVIQYADFADWQRRWLRGDLAEALLAYWREQLAGVPVTELPTDRPRSEVATRRGTTRVSVLPSHLRDALIELAQATQSTLFMVLLAAFKVLLSRYTGHIDVAAGTPVANRRRRETEDLIGFFVNTLVLRTDLSGDPGFPELLSRVRELTLGAYTHQDLPFERLVAELRPERSLSHTPLFQVMFAFQNVPPGSPELPELTLTSAVLETGTAKFDLALSIAEHEQELVGSWEYDADLFDSTTMVRLNRHLLRLLESAVEDPAAKVSALSLLTQVERHQLWEWNDTRTNYPIADTAGGAVHRLFERRTAETPDSMAIVSQEGATGETRSSYSDLNRRGNQLACHLRGLGVGPQTRIGLCLERSVSAVAAMLGILKAGGAYVALDPSYPRQRLDYMVKDAGLAFVLSESRLASALPETGVHVVCLDDDGVLIARRSTENPRLALDQRHLAYVMYTSGSTGRPKGVAVEHGSLLDLVSWHRVFYQVSRRDRASQLASLSFDAAVWEIWPYLASGASLHLAEEARRSSAPELVRWLVEQGITLSFLATPLAEAALAEPTWPSSPLRAVLTGGDRLSTWPREDLGFALVNHYGPTENTVLATLAWLAPGASGPGVPPIGRPVSNAWTRVLDRWARTLPPGVPGELSIAGAGLARGYLGRPALTAQCFVPDLWVEEPGQRRYRTGDLVRWRPDGELEFMGRIDAQVKVRGFRIELGEVEAVVLEHPGVREAGVVVRDDLPGDAALVAYLAPASPEPPALSELRRFLERRLPAYMVPAFYVSLDSLPLTPNGKLDRKALPAPEATRVYVAPSSREEEILLGIWSQVLGADGPGAERLGVDDNFFHLGGHSLLATRVTSRVREAFGVEMPLRALFESPTVAALAGKVRQLKGTGEVQAPPLVALPQEGEPVLSFAQERLWFLDRLESGNAFYNIAGAVRLRGRLSVTALVGAFAEIVRRQEGLRTTFNEVDGRPVQVIHPPKAPDLGVVDLSALPVGAGQTELERLAREEAWRPFDLSRGPLMRLRLMRSSPTRHTLVVNLHHIVSDGWSMEVLIGELTVLYEALVAGQVPLLPDPEVRYADFARWQRQWLTGAVLDSELAYWREQLSGAPPVLELPSDRPRPSVRSLRGALSRFHLSRELSAALDAVARAEGVTLFMTLLAAFEALLRGYTGREDVVVGSPVAGRNRREVEALVGFFVNTLVLRGDLSGDPGFREHLGRVREVSLAAFAHQELPFEKLVEELAPERNLSTTPLVQVVFAFQETALRDHELPGLRLELVTLETGAAKFDLTLYLEPSREGLTGSLEYSTDLFDAGTMQRLSKSFESLLQGITSAPEHRLSDLPLLSAAQRQQLRLEWNDTLASLPLERCLHELIAAQVERTPEACAVLFEERVLSYRELDLRADRLARRLRGLGTGPEKRVGVCVERSAELVVALVGILKSGGAYVPLDPSYPPARLAFMLEDSKVEVLLTQKALLATLPALQAKVVCVDREADLGAVGEALPKPVARPSNLAYVIYTSGSTGRPKGAMNAHRGVANRLLWMRELYGLKASDRVLQKTPFSFDVSVWEFFWPLLTGAALLVARPGGHRDAAYLAELIARRRVTALHFVPSMLAAFLETEDLEQRCAGLRWVFLSGEALSPELNRRYAARMTAPLENLYGPTEAAVEVTRWPCAGGADRVPIGRPIANVRIYLLDRAQRPVSVGVHGELHIGGVAVARGYLDRPGLTAQCFVADSCSAEPGARLYRTGDLARYLPSGDVEFLGRIDHQVKVRGFRIELPEIESVLEQHPEVREAAVLIREDLGSPRLVAYLVPVVDGRSARHPHEAWLAQVSRHLGENLPEYMVPSAMVVLDALPLTPSGKLDRRALPDPERPHEDRERVYVAPSSPEQEALVGIWSEVLELDGARGDRLSVEDDFFHLGGHSLLATRVMSRVRALFGVELPMRTLFESPTVTAFAERVREAKGVASVQAPPLVALSRDRELVLSFAQERLWFLDQLEPGSAFYNIPAALRLQGPLSMAALTRALTEILGRHDSLRTTFATVGGRPVQVIHPPEDPRLAWVDLGKLPADGRQVELARLAREEAWRPFDLARGPLVRLRLVRLSPAEHALVVNQHHIVSDGWSLKVLIHELAVLYEAFADARTVSDGATLLPEPAVQYADFAHWQRQWLVGEVLESELTYWREQLAGAPPVLELPSDRPRPPTQSFRGALSYFRLPRELSIELSALGRAERVTLFMTLLAAFTVLLRRYAGHDDIVVGSPVAGRNRREVEGLIGFFVNTLVLRTDLSGEPSFREHLGRVREVALAAYAHQEMPFGKLVEELVSQRQTSHNPLFQVMFALENAPRSEFRIGALDAELFELDSRTAQFDLTLSLGEESGGISGHLEYNTDLFDATTARRLVRHCRALLAATIAHPERPISALSMLDRAETSQLFEWGHGAISVPPERCLHEPFEAQAEATPEALALLCGSEQLTYRELDESAGRLAHHLRCLGVAPEVTVGVLLPRSSAGVISLLAVLKAGGVYVPLDPALPRERLEFLIADARPRVVLTRGELAFGVVAPHVVDLDADRRGAAVAAVSGAGADPANLAYLLYTSGSTGRPKGVAVCHREAAAHCATMVREFALTTRDRMLQFAAPSFDPALEQTLATLSSGARLVLRSEELWTPSDFLHHAVALELTFADLPMAYWHELVRTAADDESALTAHRLRLFVVSGEALAPEAVRLWQRSPLAAVAAWNVYGPTEAVISATCFRLATDSGLRSRVPIGRPLAGREVYVLDRTGRPVPAGVTGHLHLGGVLARGYLDRPALTAASFVPHFSSSEPGRRLYRTGDLACFLATGDLDFLGRVDHQVKVRGFRIELGEIESQLTRHPAVDEAVVEVASPREGAGPAGLVAYVVRAGAAERELSESLRDFLRGRLPSYMQPVAYVALDSLPKSATGKVDRRALPAVDFEPGVAGQEAPRSPTEAFLVEVFSALLGTPVGIRDNFFELGGHSLLATQVVSRVRQTLQVELPLRHFFEAPTVAALAERLEAQRRRTAGVEAQPMIPVPRDATLPLSFSQLRQWFLDRLDPGDPGFNIPSAFHLEGPLDVSALARGLNEVIRRHESLRTIFTDEGGEPRQLILPRLELALPQVDLAFLPGHVREAELRRRLRAEANYSFDLTRGPLLRFTLLRLEDQAFVLAVNLHHIISDGWSIGVFIREMAHLYSCLHAGKTSDLRPLELQYADYASWQRRRLEGEAMERGLAYWRRQLADHPGPLPMPFDRPRPANRSSLGALCRTVLAPRRLEALGNVGRTEGTTLFMNLAATLQVLLGRWSGRNDVSLGTYIANRHRGETEGLIGFFINTLVLRGRIRPHRSFRGFLRQLRRVILEAYAHQEIPFEKVLEAVQPERDPSTTPLFQVMCVLQNTPGPAPWLEGVELRELEPDERPVHYDLTFWMEEDGGALRIACQYARVLFDTTTVERLLEHLLVLLAAVPSDHRRDSARMPLLGAAQRQQLLVEWSGRTSRHRTAPEGSGGFLVHRLFETQVGRSPERSALSNETARMSYGELDQLSARLAEHLRALGAGPEVPVAVCIERSFELIVSLLAVVKAGSFYVPLDPSYPHQRLAFMLEDSASPVVLTRRRWLDRLPEHRVRAVCVDEDLPRVTVASPEHAEALPSDGTMASHPIYAIYTSGSTGRPKGVLIEHHALANYVVAAARELGISPGDRVLQFASISFDTSAEEIYPCLIRGATLVLRPETVETAASFLERCHRQRISFLDLPTAYWHELTRGMAQEGLSLPPCVRQVVVGGEEVQAPSLETWWRRVGRGPRLFNTYGPTEGTIVSTLCDLSRWSQPAVWMRVPIGRPVPGVEVGVLDRHLQPVPAGAGGELHLAGAGLARGYLHKPRSSAERFVPHPNGAAGERLYRTGDLVRFLSDGQVEFLGRSDHQVKVRGFRVELGEVETALLSHPAVGGAAVVAHRQGSGDPRLVAYFSAAGGSEEPTGEILRAAMRDRLPQYMVPAFFVHLEELPLTPTGKVDRSALVARALPEPAKNLEREGELVAGRTGVETRLAAIWCEVLGIEQVGRHENFFELGGDSILGLQIISQAHQAGLQLSPQHLFRHQTLAELAAVADSHLVEAEQGHVSGELPLTPYQVWFFEELRVTAPEQWNLSVFLELRRDWPSRVLEQAIDQLLLHHDALRLRFLPGEDGWRQVNAPPTDGVPFHCIELPAGPQATFSRAIEVAAAQIQTSLDLETGPLLRAVLFCPAGDEAARLLLVVHHMVVDVVSWHVLLEDLGTVCGQLLHGQEPRLPAKSTSFKHWARRLDEYSRSAALEKEADVWIEPPPAQLSVFPVDFPGGENVEGSTESALVTLEPSETRSLLQEVPKAYNTQINDVLLAALLLAFNRRAGGRALAIDLESHGRADLFEDVDVSRTVGCFTALYPVLLELSEDADCGSTLRTVKDQLRRIPHHGVGYGLLRYLNPEPAQESCRRERLPAAASFNYVGQLDQGYSEESPFVPAQESYGPIRSFRAARGHPIEILAGISEGRLEVRWIYSRNLHRKASVSALADEFIAALRELIEHCLLPESARFTPSDFDLADLSENDLTTILTELTGSVE